jgi:hypothetical protein
MGSAGFKAYVNFLLQLLTEEIEKAEQTLIELCLKDVPQVHIEHKRKTFN